MTRRELTEQESEPRECPNADEGRRRKLNVVEIIAFSGLWRSSPKRTLLYGVLIKVLGVSNLLECPLQKHRWAGRQQGIMVIDVMSGQAGEKSQSGSLIMK